MNRKRLVLAALLGLLVLSIAYAFWAMPRQEQAPPRVAAPRPAVKANPPGKASQPAANRLHLGLLAQSPQPFPGSGRDLFRFHGDWNSAPLVDVAPLVEEAPPPPPSPPPTPEELLRKDLSSYKVLGFLDKRGTRSLFLTDGNNITVIKAGERFGARNGFIAREISATELVVQTADRSATTITLPLEQGSNLEPAVMAPVSVSRPGIEAEPTPPSRPLVRRSRARPGYGGEETAGPEETPQPEEAPPPEEAPQPQKAPQPQEVLRPLTAPQPKAGAPDADAAVKDHPSGDQE